MARTISHAPTHSAGSVSRFTPLFRCEWGRVHTRRAPRDAAARNRYALAGDGAGKEIAMFITQGRGAGVLLALLLAAAFAVVQRKVGAF